MKIYLLIVILFYSTSALFAQTDSTKVKANLSYGGKGWELKYGQNFMMQMQWRLQFRFVSGPEPYFFLPEEDNSHGSFNIQRARLKVGGYAFKPYLKYYLEYDFPSNNLLNFEFTLAKFQGLQLKIGQWKINYNTERYVSSGKQQFVDRSVANRYFTFDRQVGVMLQGNLFEGKLGASTYHLGIFNGDGRGEANHNSHYLYMARYQWNFTKNAPSMSFSDIEKVTKPEGYISLSVAQNTSAYTSFSSSGGGQIPGFEEGLENRYNIKQLGFELFYKHQGFSFMSENHIKDVQDNLLHQKSKLYGGYVMAGYFPNQLISFFPSPLEISTRYSMISHAEFTQDKLKELSFGLNWFFKGHRNKLSADLAFIENLDFVEDKDGIRFRIQWDVSF